MYDEAMGKLSTPLARPSADRQSGATSYPHIEVSDSHPARLTRLPRVRVAQIIMDYKAHGWAVDELCRQYPHLTRAEAHAAMLYYWDHQEEIEQEIEEEARMVARYAAEAPKMSPDLLERLRERLSA